MNIAQVFPDTVEEFMQQNRMVDEDHVYSNGVEYVPIFRMMQWFEHHPERKNGEVKPVTNADRIRSMTDEELAEFISDIKLRAFKYFGHTGDYDEIVESNLEWLKQEAE